MEFNQTFSRKYMVSAYERHRTTVRLQRIREFIERESQQVVHSAVIGKTQHTIELCNKRQTGWNADNYTPTNEELIEGFRAKFPGCNVEHGDTWESSPRNPNQMNKKSGIVIDWS